MQLFSTAFTSGGKLLSGGGAVAVRAPSDFAPSFAWGFDLLALPALNPSRSGWTFAPGLELAPAPAPAAPAAPG
eukprot:CAMPEP_0114682854 /NCGR_PEP_ID=MMETSP0191-20121206/57148_1 /TAXON_ID=126664 /ORGANISM="Sorites sp." /LENGTH=73 /DNA_ID=CAMNT_0001963261 /DNA_START=276 /DNA_END=495 /DNA_ORIENTATION=-